MDIINFNRIRVGSGFPAIVDISPIHGHEQNGLIVEVGNGPHLEVREKYGVHALFVFRNYEPFAQVPEYWQDAQIVWSGNE